MTQYVIVLLLVFLCSCLAFVVVTYSLAFGLFGWLSNRMRVRAAVRELVSSLVLVPLWPFWWVLGARYRRRWEGRGRVHAGRNPVLLLHGFAMNRTQWVWLGRRLAETELGPVYGRSYFSLRSIASSAVDLSRMIDEICARENTTQVDIVAHSLGGLVARYFIERLDGAKRVGRLVTIATPHRGTRLGRLGLVPVARELIVGLPFPEQPPRVRYAAIWSPDDAVVQPAESAALGEWGSDYTFPGEGHLSMLMAPSVLDRLTAELRS